MRLWWECAPAYAVLRRMNPPDQENDHETP